MAELSLLEFADKMNTVMPIIAKEFASRQMNELYKGKITLPQFLLLELLDKQGESKMTVLARFMKVTTAAMTGIVDRLVRDDYAVRVYEPEDRRIIKVKLTSKGADLVKRINHQRRKMIIEIFARISKEDRQDYLGVLMQIRDILIQEKEIR